MNRTRPINLFLAILTAIWTPVWCCCASHGASQAKQSILSTTHGCPNCPLNASFSDQQPSSDKGTTSNDCPTCPHVLLKAWAQLDKSPEIKASILPTFFLLLADITRLEMPVTAATFAPPQGDSPPLSPIASLYSLHCMLTI